MPHTPDRHLWVKILLGLVLGIGIGLALSPEAGALFSPETTDVIAEWIELPGLVFLGLLKMVVVPLVICSIITCFCFMSVLHVSLGHVQFFTF